MAALALLGACGGGIDVGADDSKADPAPTTTADDDEEEADVFDPDAADGGDDEDGDEPEVAPDAEQQAVFDELLGDATVPPGEPVEIETVVIEDGAGELAVEVPADWRDLSATNPEGGDRGFLAASPDLEAFAETWDVPAITVYTSGSEAETSREAFDAFAAGEAGEYAAFLLDACDLAGDITLEHHGYDITAGYLDDCEGTDTDVVTARIVTGDGQLLTLDAQVVERRDLSAVGVALSTVTFEPS